MIVIIDYGMGNLRTVQRKFERLKIPSVLSADPIEIEKATKLILPGVGHFANGVKKLQESGIWDILNKKVMVDKIPVLGICLGMQLMAKYSEEGDKNGLGWLDATVIKFDINNKKKYKVPHMGWNTTEILKPSILFKNISYDSLFYFVHSYHILCNDSEDVLCTSEYEYSFTSAIQHNNIFGTQFHPEKSFEAGDILLLNFANI
jgi:imidazole glycerol-phosphate synthase subunit HisH